MKPLRAEDVKRPRPKLAAALQLGAQRILKMAAKELDEANVDPDFVAELAMHAVVLLDHSIFGDEEER